MELNTKSNIYLLASGVLLFILGGLIVYIVSVNTTVTSKSTPATPVVVDSGVVEGDTYAWHAPADYKPTVREYDTIISLSEPDIIGNVPVETALYNRRTIRSFSDVPLNLEQVSQMLWSAIGVTTEDGKRTAPSRGGENPTSVFLVAADIENLEPGLYEYLEDEHALGLVRLGDFSADWEIITHQSYPMNAPGVMLITGDMFKQYSRYGDITERLVLQESGHIGQNLYLQAESIDIGMVVMGGFDTVAGQEFLGTAPNEPVIYLVPFGNRTTPE